METVNKKKGVTKVVAPFTLKPLNEEQKERLYSEESKLYSRLDVYRGMTFNVSLLKERYKDIIYNQKGTERSEFGFYLTQNFLTIYHILLSLKTKSLLDLGSGPGLLLQSLCSIVNVRVGYEIEDVFVEDGRSVFNQDIKKKDILTLTKKDVKSFEVLFFYEPFTPYNHIQEKENSKPKEFIDNLVNILTKGQYILYDQAGEIGKHILESGAFEQVTYTRGIYLYKFIGKPKTTNN